MTENESGLTFTFARNRREHRRHDVLINVQLRDEERLQSLYATDLSKGGLFLATRSNMVIGEAAGVKLIHPLTEETFEIECIVSNERQDRSGAVKGYGLRFAVFNEKVLEELSQFVEGVIEFDLGDEMTLIETEDVKPPPLPPDATGEEERAQVLLRQGRHLAGKGNLVGAVHVLSRATALTPTDETLWEALDETEGLFLEETAEAESLDLDLSELEETADRRKCKLLFESARDRHCSGDTKEAVSYLEKALKIDPSFLPAYCALAKMLAEGDGDLERSVSLCKKALEYEPDYEQAIALLALFESKMTP